MELITTAEAAALIHRSEANTSTILQREQIRPFKKRGKALWPKDEVEKLVATKQEYQEPYRAGPGIAIAMGPARNRPKKKREWQEVIAIAQARMEAGIRVGDYKRYDKVFNGSDDEGGDVTGSE